MVLVCTLNAGYWYITFEHSFFFISWRCHSDYFLIIDTGSEILKIQNGNEPNAKKKYPLDLFGVLVGASWSIIDFATNLILHWEEVIELVVGELSWDNAPTLQNTHQHFFLTKINLSFSWSILVLMRAQLNREFNFWNSVNFNNCIDKGHPCLACFGGFIFVSPTCVFFTMIIKKVQVQMTHMCWVGWLVGWLVGGISSTFLQHSLSALTLMTKNQAKTKRWLETQKKNRKAVN